MKIRSNSEFEKNIALRRREDRPGGRAQHAQEAGHAGPARGPRLARSA